MSQMIPLQMLGTRSRMEQLADEIWPGVRPVTEGLYKSYDQILFSNETRFTTNSRVQTFRQMVKDSPITKIELLATVHDLHSIFSKKAAHPAGFNAPVPEANDTEGIRNMLKIFNLIPDKSKIEAIKLFLTEFPIPISNPPTGRTSTISYRSNVPRLSSYRSSVSKLSGKNFQRPKGWKKSKKSKKNWNG